MRLKGYVLQDASGIFGFVPDSQQDRYRAWDYVKKNKPLKTLYAEPDENIIDFILRVQEEAEKVRAAMRPN